MKKVLIIGPYITNIGGVSIHISRLMHLLKGDFEFDFIDDAGNARLERNALNRFDVTDVLPHFGVFQESRFFHGDGRDGASLLGAERGGNRSEDRESHKQTVHFARHNQFCPF